MGRLCGRAEKRPLEGASRVPQALRQGPLGLPADAPASWRSAQWRASPSVSQARTLTIWRAQAAPPDWLRPSQGVVSRRDAGLADGWESARPSTPMDRVGPPAAPGARPPSRGAGYTLAAGMARGSYPRGPVHHGRRAPGTELGGRQGPAHSCRLRQRLSLLSPGKLAPAPWSCPGHERAGRHGGLAGGWAADRAGRMRRMPSVLPGVALMLEHNMAAGRLAKAGQPLKLAVGHQRRQGSARQGICHD